MKKGLAIGATSIALLMLVGCQQQPVQPSAPVNQVAPSGQSAEAQASLTVTEPVSTQASATAVLQVMPAEEGTQAAANASLNVTPSTEQNN
ncbi:MAG TPA: hypothetical protein P5229_00655 [Candidatus Gracilibacteria bacterium]|nr:hypothetical protein [Candidatus Gracilibacteria bacterium]